MADFGYARTFLKRNPFNAVVAFKCRPNIGHRVGHHHRFHRIQYKDHLGNILIIDHSVVLAKIRIVLRYGKFRDGRARKGTFQNFFNTRRNPDFFERTAIFKGICTDGLQALGQMDGCQRYAIAKCAHRYLGNAIRNGDGGEGDTSVECITIDGFNPFRNDHLADSAHFFDGIGVPLNTRRQGNSFFRPQIGNQRICPVFLGKSEALLRIHVFKFGAVDPVYPIPISIDDQLGLLGQTPVFMVTGDKIQGGMIIHHVQNGTGHKCPFLYIFYVFAENNLRKIRTIKEGLLSDYFHAVRDRYPQNTFAF